MIDSTTATNPIRAPIAQPVLRVSIATANDPAAPRAASGSQRSASSRGVAQVGGLVVGQGLSRPAARGRGRRRSATPGPGRAGPGRLQGQRPARRPRASRTTNTRVRRGSQLSSRPMVRAPQSAPPARRGQHDRDQQPDRRRRSSTRPSRPDLVEGALGQGPDARCRGPPARSASSRHSAARPRGCSDRPGTPRSTAAARRGTGRRPRPGPSAVTRAEVNHMIAAIPTTPSSGQDREPPQRPPRPARAGPRSAAGRRAGGPPPAVPGSGGWSWS